MVTVKDPHYALRCITTMGVELMLILEINDSGGVTGGNGKVQQWDNIRILGLFKALLHPS